MLRRGMLLQPVRRCPLSAMLAPPARRLQRLRTSAPAVACALSVQAPLRPPLPLLAAAPSNRRHDSLSLPNLITGSRIALSPLLAWLVLHEHYGAALAGCTVAAATDAADGIIARHWQMETVLGSYLDPLADKVFVGSMYTSLAVVGAIDARLAALVVARDLALVAGTGFALWQHTRGADVSSTSDVVRALARQPIRVRPTMASKVNTGVQVTLVGATLMDALGCWPAGSSKDVLSVAVAICTCASMASYLPTLPMLRGSLSAFLPTKPPR
ncbi:CDP-alcohol phosphatidyltransferase-domain-containing protein [Pavlovales sp. CCMP2436]|nr:CDP-alcohol phosphatidyltransferase-domain-containing protein [Pavlovales sp. CCMP2436]